MLVFFLHGVATKDAQYAKLLQELITKHFHAQDQTAPKFHSGFWGNFAKETDVLWHGIEQELIRRQEQDTSFDKDKLFRY
jgi:hypothetical protein